MSGSTTSATPVRRPRFCRGRRTAALAALVLHSLGAWAAPYVPRSDAEVLAELPMGARHSAAAAQDVARTRLDVALPLARFDVERARATGDLRFLGYAEAALAPWLAREPVSPDVLILDATVQQSRHAFERALTELDRALALRPQDPQAWLTKATILRVLGRYPVAQAACAHLAERADPAVGALCVQGIESLTGRLRSAYETVRRLDAASMPPLTQAWRFSELGEMAERLGDDAAAERWFADGLGVAPEDFYLRIAYADLLIRGRRPAEVLRLVEGRESMEPLLLRKVIALRIAGAPDPAADARALAAAFEYERRRGDVVHGREEARFLLDVADAPEAALAAALANWRVQREPDDALIVVRAARGAARPSAAAAVLAFVDAAHAEDARLAAERLAAVRSGS